jgi:ABC-type phosphate transport system permease subunit
LGEAIAVSLVIGDANGIHASLFRPASTLAERIANQFQNPVNTLHLSAMFYAGLVLLVIGLVTTLLARTIAGRFDVERSTWNPARQ